MGDSLKDFKQRSERKGHLHCEVECELGGSETGSPFGRGCRITQDKDGGLVWGSGTGDWIEMEDFEIY